MKHPISILRVLLIVMMALAGIGAVVACAWGLNGHQHFTTGTVSYLVTGAWGTVIGLVAVAPMMYVFQLSHTHTFEESRTHKMMAIIEVYSVPFIAPFIGGMIGLFYSPFF